MPSGVRHEYHVSRPEIDNDGLAVCLETLNVLFFDLFFRFDI